MKRMLWRYIEIGWKTCVFFEIFRLMTIIRQDHLLEKKLDNSIIFVENNNNNNNNNN